MYAVTLADGTHSHLPVEHIDAGYRGLSRISSIIQPKVTGIYSRNWKSSITYSNVPVLAQVTRCRVLDRILYHSETRQNKRSNFTYTPLSFTGVILPDQTRVTQSFHRCVGTATHIGKLSHQHRRTTSNSYSHSPRFLSPIEPILLTEGRLAHSINQLKHFV